MHIENLAGQIFGSMEIGPLRTADGNHLIRKNQDITAFYRHIIMLGIIKQHCPGKAGMVIENRLKKGLFGIKNMSDDVWKAKFPDNSIREVAPGKGVPIWTGLEIDFGDNLIAKILL